MTAHQDFHQTDPSGLLTLERFARANQFNRWLFNGIASYCQGRVLEIGSGIGNMSGLFLEKNFKLTVSDLRTEYLDTLKHKFGSHPLLEGVEQLDVLRRDFRHAYAHLAGRFDTVVALNVVEHVQNDTVALDNIKTLLKAGGCFIILVPAWQTLYNTLDRELGHYRRYNRRSLNRLLRSAELDVVKIFYFNAAGIAGWALNGSKKIVPATQLRIFNRLVPLFKFIDWITARQLGLSIIGISKKK